MTDKELRRMAEQALKRDTGTSEQYLARAVLVLLPVLDAAQDVLATKGEYPEVLALERALAAARKEIER